MYGGAYLLNDQSSEPPEPEEPPSTNYSNLWFIQLNNETWCLRNLRVNSRVSPRFFLDK